MGKHGYSGEWAPGANKSCVHRSETFSYGIYEMVPAKTTVTGWKKGTVKVRVSGFSSDAELIKATCESVVAELDAGTYKGPKYVRVKPAV